jgi:Flp pilus assembly protein TadG
MQRLRDEKGQGSVELILILPAMIFLIAFIFLFGRVLYVRIALDMATYDCAREAVESLRELRGLTQAAYAGWNTLEGFHLDPDDAVFTVAYNRWSRGGEVTCQAAFKVYTGDLPFLRGTADRGVSLYSSTTLQVERYISRWEW